MIWFGETKKRGAERSLPALSLTLTVEPAKVVGSGTVVATCTAVARFAPKAATMDSGASRSGA